MDLVTAVDPQVVVALKVFYSAFWLMACWPKLHDPIRFSGVINAYELVPTDLSVMLSLSIGVTEFSIAVGLWFTPTISFAAFIGIGLIGLYALSIGINLWRGRHSLDCGCLGFGRTQPIGSWMLLRHLVLCGGLWMISSGLIGRELMVLDVVLAVAAGGVMIVMYLTIDSLKQSLPDILKVDS